jgi:toxin ParE1/3/4
MARYKITVAAQGDLEQIYCYGVLHYGLKKTEEDTSGMLSQFEELAKFPKRYPAIDYIRKGYRRCVYGAHSIFYQILDDEILIVRIIGRQFFSLADEESRPLR